MLFIGITGGVGAGKSEILSYLEQKKDVRVMLADEIAHQVMEPKEEAYMEIVNAPSEEELNANPRARSSKLRVIERIK